MQPKLYSKFGTVERKTTFFYFKVESQYKTNSYWLLVAVTNAFNKSRLDYCNALYLEIIWRFDQKPDAHLLKVTKKTFKDLNKVFYLLSNLLLKLKPIGNVMLSKLIKKHDNSRRHLFIGITIQKSC